MSLLSIVAFFVAVILAFMFMDWGVTILDDYLEGFNGFLPYLAFALIFITAGASISLLGKALKKVLDLTLLGSFDNIAGAILGVTLWVFAISVFIWLTDRVGFELPNSWTQDSVLYEKIRWVAPMMIDGLSEYIPMIKDLFDSITDRLQPAIP